MGTTGGTRVVTRRAVLRSLGLAAGAAGAGGLLAACSTEERIPAAAPGVDARTPQARGLPAGEPAFSVQNASYESLAGGNVRLNLVVTENDRTPIDDPDVTVWVRGVDGDLVSGPHPTTYVPEVSPGVAIAVHQTLVPLPDPGFREIIAVSGDRYGVAAIEVTDPAQAEAPVPGSPATSTATPTEAAPLGYERICTDDPACGMHGESLDAVLAAGRPVLLLFATPAYCQTAVCAPAVTNLEAVRTARDWGDLAFVHVEVFPSQAAAGNLEVGEPVAAWRLPTEPWVFAIDRDGEITERMDGILLTDDMNRMAESLAGA
jgi:hypothetical protein